MGKVFARYYDAFMKPVEDKFITSWRKELLTHARGKVLEIGAGTGINFRHYQHCDKVIALEPNTYMIEKAEEKGKQASVPITIIEGRAEKLPFANEQFDTVVVTLVLCSVDNPTQAVAEMKRVLKPSGRILIIEHVKMQQPLFAILQNMITPLWKRLCDGCHLNRNTEQTVKDAGFEIISMISHLSSFAVTIIAKKS
ncbi:class I SAM-dependent methyltransferase [Anaerobacillus sp. CMMVII]|uniref:class I SAM-dependent methyltransferase n=1 Tax=Anaerobacillus sp. CMMVII TaxID=2755588 RepID=UPI0021B7A7EE|nr:class I SAM-dependent methyltransferase [Anaerobacillus sp. CMMVII]MCT8136715.1 class I SAM-dependent methyltransferase [Anaerobacillus sp. CMMVII]